MKTPMRSFVPATETTADLRRAFGRYGTGVTVVTTKTPTGLVGMTANSFTSVSLDPALVLWSPATSSKRHDIFASAAGFCVHVLGADQLALAQHFATQGHDFETVDWIEGPTGAPTLQGCLAAFHCETYAVHPAGDHSLILGHVKSAAMRENDDPGLMFDRGRFGQFAPQS
ncbi:flavin oxidoreductase [Sulfitobacter sp. SK012]|nr:flavin oxidoreductase [Sulfitobacter sp. SK012]